MTNDQIIKRCATFAAIYFNSATLQKNYTIQEYIVLAMQDYRV